MHLGVHLRPLDALIDDVQRYPELYLGCRVAPVSQQVCCRPLFSSPTRRHLAVLNSAQNRLHELLHLARRGIPYVKVIRVKRADHERLNRVACVFAVTALHRLGQRCFEHLPAYRLAILACGDASGRRPHDLLVHFRLQQPRQHFLCHVVSVVVLRFRRLYLPVVDWRRDGITPALGRFA
jgi:hypothetical protein